MNNYNSFFSAENFAIYYRVLGIIALYIFWLKNSTDTSGLFILLLLIIMILLRWRSKGLKVSLLIDLIICISGSFFWSGAAYGLTLLAFDAAFFYFPWAYLAIIIYLISRPIDILLLLLLLQSAFTGFSLWAWQNYKKAAITKMDMDSKRRYELEGLKNDLLIAHMQAAKTAELFERNRIAREIHDHAGHEIIAAYMSLQVLESLWQNEDIQIQEMLRETISRLEKGIDTIRETVHNLAPLTPIGIDALKKLCNDFSFCPIAMQIYGDSSKIPIYLWSILEPCLKEALTNIVRHSEAKKVSVLLDITPYIVRLSVENDGIKNPCTADGIGLRNLRQRASAAGGNISITLKEYFRLICVLPINIERNFL